MEIEINMEIELKTKNLKEILKVCDVNKLDPAKIYLKTKIFEDIRYPDVPIVKLYLSISKK